MRWTGTHANSIGFSMRTKLAGFVRTLRDNGFAVGLAESRDAFAILASPAADRAATMQAALRALFSADHSDFERFDALFAAYWRGDRLRSRLTSAGLSGSARESPARAPHTQSRHRRSKPGPLREMAEGGDSSEEEGRGRHEGASAADALESTDIRHIVDPNEIARAHDLAARLSKAMRVRIVRRERIRSRGPRLDLRRIIHKSISHGGTPLELAFRKRKPKPLRLVVLLDASGSMSLYTAFFVRFLHGAVDAFREAEAFVFHTRLAHVSPSLRDRNVTRAVEKLALMAEGIGGGTRIGDSLATFNRWHAKRVINSRTVLMIVSDGYDTGAPEALAAEMRRIRRRCRRIVWLNPLISWAGYTPAARGMQAALPYVDLFAPAHNLKSLAALEPYLARLG